MLPTNANAQQPPTSGSSKRSPNVTTLPKPKLITNNHASPIINTPAASISTAVNNNINNNNIIIPTVQGLTNEFNTMQGDVSLLKNMLGNLTSMLQNAIG